MCSGIGFEVNPSTTLILGYRYFATTDPEFEAVFGIPGAPIETTTESHDFSLGARFMF